MYSSRLRQFSQARGHLPSLHPCTKTPKHSTEELLADLKGYNGKWKQQRAGVELERIAEQKHELDLKDRLKEEKKQRGRDLEQAILKEIEQEREEERQEILVHARARERAAQRKADAEQERKRQVLAKIEERRRSFLRVTCDICSGTGLCPECNGKGCHPALFLSATVREGTEIFHGLTASGCMACGGTKAGTMKGDVLSGTGKCKNCNGLGSKISAEVEANIDRVKRASQIFRANTSAFSSGRATDVDESDVDWSDARDRETSAKIAAES